MSSEAGVRLVWDSKGEKLAERKIFFNECDLIYPHPVWQTDNLFYDEIDIQKSRTEEVPNRIFYGDNLDAVKVLLDEGYKGKVDLIYIDPPYLSDSQYYSRIKIGEKTWLSRPAFEDKWDYGLESYLDSLYNRLLCMKELLSEKGSIFVHLDWHVSHYVKLLLDEIFLPENFINEIVWCYTGGSGTKRHFHRKHDLILWYARGKDYIFNPQFRPYSRGTLERGLTRVKGDKYSLSSQGAIMQDWWIDINKILSPTAKENLKFPTQKPAALLKRLIATASNPDSIVADFYAGSGTSAEVCEEMGRRWIICDSSKIAVQTSKHRLIRRGVKAFKFESINNIVEPGKNGIKFSLKKPFIHKIEKDYSNLIIGIDEPSKDEYEDYLQAGDGTALIDFWEIDLNFKGGNFSSDIQIIREKNNYHNSSIPLEVRLRLPKGKRNIGLKIHDILGNSTLDIIEIKI